MTDAQQPDPRDPTLGRGPVDPGRHGDLTGDLADDLADGTPGYADADRLEKPDETPGEDADFSDTLDFSGSREEDEEWSEADLFVLLDFLTELTEALTAAGAAAGQISSDVEDAARAFGVRSVQVLVFTTAVFISLPKIAPGRVKMAAALLPSLRLDQIAAVYRLMDEVQTGYVTPASALRRLRSIEAMPSRFSRAMTILGHAVLAVGLGLILGPGTVDILVAGVLGAGVAVVKRWAARGQGRDQILPAAVSFAVAAMVFFAAKHGAVINPMHALLPPLVTFLPGAALTTATLELSSGHTMSGSSRLVAAGVQLGLLAFGIISAAQLVGLPPAAAFASDQSTIGLLTPWLGVLVFSVGVYLHFSVPQGTLLWVLLVLYVAYAAQVVGSVFFGGYLSGFVGAIVMVPVALFVSRQPSGPPMMVTFLPSFWLLVPGALSLVGLTQLLSADGQAGLQTLVNAAGTVVAIALGVLVGIGVDEALVTGHQRGADTFRRFSRSLGRRADDQPPGGPAAAGR